VTDPVNIALFYDDGGYVETLRPPTAAAAGEPIGLMGRQVAGKEFLDAYLSHGSWTELVALVRRRDRADSLVRLCQEHPSSRSRRRRLQIVEERHFFDRFYPDPPARLLYTPHPPDTRFAWARQHGGATAFALCGVTHTLSSAAAARQICDFVTAPYEPFDAVICTSRAVVSLVRTLAETYSDDLRRRHGGTPGLRPRLELIPLGVDPEKFRPPTPEERAARRQALGVAADEVAVLFVGRLSHHAKAHPFPMFHGVARAARDTGRRAHLILAGWAANPAIRRAFEDGARAFAPAVRVSVIDGTRPEIRHSVWHAADVFVSLADNVQETFGLVVIEAMACGLPVVASDWDGYRDLVVADETGFLAPTALVSGAAASASARLVLGAVGLDQFLAECSQATVVDAEAAGAALARLFRDEALRQAMGAAGRRRVLDRFTWAGVIRAYEQLWRSQEEERRARAATTDTAPRGHAGPACFPAIDHSFAGYPSVCLDGGARLQSVAGAGEALPTLLGLPLTNHVAETRVSDAAVLRAVLAAASAGCPLAALDEVLRGHEVGHEAGRTTIAWLLKYGLLRCSP
jgi:glycosyltransferase involved in cell wall biosynthesis